MCDLNLPTRLGAIYLALGALQSGFAHGAVIGAWTIATLGRVRLPRESRCLVSRLGVYVER